MAGTELTKANEVFALIEQLGQLLDERERPDATNEFAGADGLLRYRRGARGNWVFSGFTAPPPHDPVSAAPTQRSSKAGRKDIAFDINQLG